MIDLRSDTVSQPTDAMRAAMVAAVVGDDVFGDDPTVNELQERVAELLGFEAGLFTTSGTQANLCALLSHCQRGDEYLVGQSAHTFRYEAGGASVLGGIVAQPVELRSDGTFDLDLLFGYIKPADPHFAQARLLTLENTKDGHPLPPDYVTEAQQRARSAGLRLHLDGARLWNAAIAGGSKPAAIAAGYDSVSVCLSKGLGAPAGSVLVGSIEFVREARRWRKMLGGAMRQTGLLAAAGMHALDHHVERLAEDHVNAARLAEGLGAIAPFEVLGQATNMVYVKLNLDPVAFGRSMADAGIVVLAGPVTRLVTHLGVDAADIDQTIEAAAAFAAAA